MKKIIFLTICIVLLIVIVNLSKSIYDLYHKKDLLTSTQKKLVVVEKENQQLKHQLVQVQNPAFVEKEARDKLFLAKPGESSILLPSPTPLPKGSQDITQPYWQQWWELFWGQ